jgi:uncharacterized protein YutE (UPF0331/DUF86 family)
MVSRIKRLLQYRRLTLEDFLASEDTQLIVERLLELVIQSSLDINRTLLKRAVKAIEMNRAQPIGNKESFLLLGQYEILPSDFASLMSLSGSFRNVLAHFYDDIEPDKVYEALQFSIANYPIYIRQIQGYLNSLEIESSDGTTEL